MRLCSGQFDVYELYAVQRPSLAHRVLCVMLFCSICRCTKWSAVDIIFGPGGLDAADADTIAPIWLGAP